MEVEVIPLTDFCHGSINALEGRPQPIERSIALELEKAGLVRIRMTGLPGSAPMVQGAPVAGKSQDDGAGRPSSALPAAQVSPSRTLRLSKAGGSKPRRSGM